MILLDIECFFRGEMKDRVLEILEYCGFDAKTRPNEILRDFNDYLMDDAGHVTANYDNNVYNDQSYCYGNLSQQKFCFNKL